MRNRWWIVVAVSLALALPVRAAEAPRGVHLSFGPDPQTSMTVAWHTPGTANPGGAVRYGSAPDALTERTEARSQAAIAGMGVVLHEATLTGLTPGARVYYSAGIDGAWSPVRSFRTAPADGRALRVVLFADHGMSAAAQRTTAAALAEDPDMVLVAGDLSYADKQPVLWNDWFEQIEPLAATVPFMVAPGNHDTDETPEMSQIYRQRFALPGQEIYYAFDFARIRFVIFHSTLEIVVREGDLGPQLAWLEQELLTSAARRDAGEIDFIAVVQHHPLYGDSRDTSVGGPYLERHYNTPWIAMEEHFLHRHDVDLLLAGHNHHYERSKPMAYARPTTDEMSNYVDPLGFIEVISGGGGGNLYQFRDPNDFGAWPAVWAMRHHYVRFDIEPGVIRATAISTDHPAGEVLDTWTLRAA